MGQAPLLCTHESGNQIKLHGCMCQSCVSGLINRNKKYWRPVVCLLLWGGHYPVTQHAVTYLVLTPTHSYTHCKGGQNGDKKKNLPKVIQAISSKARVCAWTLQSRTPPLQSILCFPGLATSVLSHTMSDKVADIYMWITQVNYIST